MRIMWGSVMLRSTLVCYCLIVVVHSRSIPRFPSVKHTYHERDTTFKSRFNEKYLAISKNNNGQYYLTTKPLIQDSSDSDLIFDFHFFTVAEKGESKLGVFHHTASNVSLRMTSDRTLGVQEDDDTNSIEGHVPFERTTTADSRFFYKKSSGPNESGWVFEAMNGVDYRHFLSVNVKGELELREVPIEFNKDGMDITQYPDSVVFNNYPYHNTDD